MSTASYGYAPLMGRPELLALYTGWLGQRLCFLACEAVFWNRRESWQAAEAEAGRLAGILLSGGDKRPKLLTGPPGAAMSRLLGQVGDPGWWSDEILAIRQGDGADARRLEELVGLCGEGQGARDPRPFFPMLSLDPGCRHPCAQQLLTGLADVVRGLAEALGQHGLCRCGILLSGLCHRLAGGVPVPLVDDALGLLSGRGLLGLEAENRLRRRLSLVQLNGDRRPLDTSTVPPASPPEPGHRPVDPAYAPFSGYVEATCSQADVLEGIFGEAGLAVPPEVPDGDWRADLKRLRQVLHPKGTAPEDGDRPQRSPGGQDDGSQRTRFTTQQAAAYLELNGVYRRPEMVIQRLKNKGLLRPTKLNGRNVYSRQDLDRVREKGDAARRPGRPPKPR